jgi:hypothetical protein
MKGSEVDGQPIQLFNHGKIFRDTVLADQEENDNEMYTSRNNAEAFARI